MCVFVCVCVCVCAYVCACVRVSVGVSVCEHVNTCDTALLHAFAWTKDVGLEHLTVYNLA